MSEQALERLLSFTCDIAKLTLYSTEAAVKTLISSTTSIILSTAFLPRSRLITPLVKLIGKLNDPPQVSWLHFDFGNSSEKIKNGKLEISYQQVELFFFILLL